MGDRSCHSLQDHLKHCVCILQNVIVPESQHAITYGCKSARPFFIPLHLLEMLTAIQLHNHPRIWANEIDNVAIDFMLPAKLPS